MTRHILCAITENFLTFKIFGTNVENCADNWEIDNEIRNSDCFYLPLCFLSPVLSPGPYKIVHCFLGEFHIYLESTMQDLWVVFAGF